MTTIIGKHTLIVDVPKIVYHLWIMWAAYGICTCKSLKSHLIQFNDTFYAFNCAQVVHRFLLINLTLHTCIYVYSKDIYGVDKIYMVIMKLFQLMFIFIEHSLE